MESIVVPCGCGARIKLPGTVHAGQKLRCPKCSGVVVVPESAGAGAASPVAPAAPTPATKECLYCGETILASAKKCKHCGEFLDGAEASPASPARRGGAKATAVIDHEPNPAEYFTAILLAPVGLLIGATWAMRKLPKAKKMLQVAATMCVIEAVGAWLGYYYFLREDNSGPSAPAVAQNGGPQIFVVPGGSGEEDSQPPPPPQNSGLTGGEIDIEGQPPIIQKAMKANVRLEMERGMGSGVILQRDGDEVLILTNLHVVDLRYALSRGQQATPPNDIPKPKVSYFDGQSNPGTVVWTAPDGVDLAMVKAVAPKEIEPAPWKGMPKVSAGQDVFAVGNPMGLGWTYTRGVVSALRKEKFPRVDPKRDVAIIQTDTSINSGNSGGGLYTAEGELIGINSSIVNPNMAKGLGFSIRTNILMDLKPPGLELPEAADATP